MPPSCLDDLNHAERLLLLACRRAPPGSGPQPCVDLAWRLGHGEDLGNRLASVFATLVRCLALGARRPLSLWPPHRAALSMDELSLLELVAACQCGAFAMADALARWLVRAPDRMRLLAAAAALARLMEQAGLTLRAPSEFRIERHLPVTAPRLAVAGAAHGA